MVLCCHFIAMFDSCCETSVPGVESGIQMEINKNLIDFQRSSHKVCCRNNNKEYCSTLKMNAFISAYSFVDSNSLYQMYQVLYSVGSDPRILEC